MNRDQFAAQRYLCLVPAMLLAVLLVLGHKCSAEAATITHNLSRCGSITVSGLYRATNALVAKSSNCIEIRASNVTLDLANFNVTNTGPAGSSVGINILGSVTNVTIEGANSFIEGFSIGVETGASTSGTIAEDFNVVSNTRIGILMQGSNQFFTNVFAQHQAYGIELHGCTRCIAANIYSTDNSIYGFWIFGSTLSQVFLNIAEDNAIAGVYQGCSGAAPGSACATSTFGSENAIYDTQWAGGEYGVAVDKGESRNRIFQTQPEYSNTQDIPSVDELYDGTASCGTDIWFENSFTRANQNCIQ